MPKRKSRKNKGVDGRNFTLDTGLIACGFTFGNKFREFFSKQTGKGHFKLNADMAATVKAVRVYGETEGGCHIVENR